MASILTIIPFNVNNLIHPVLMGQPCDKKILKALVDAGAHLSETNGKRQNIIHCAALANNIFALKYLSKHMGLGEHHDLRALQSILDGKDSDGNTPLHIAVKRRHLYFLRELLGKTTRRIERTDLAARFRSTSDFRIRNNAGKTALDLAQTACYGTEDPVLFNMLDPNPPGKREIDAATPSHKLEDLQRLNKSHSTHWYSEMVTGGILAMLGVLCPISFMEKFDLPIPYGHYIFSTVGVAGIICLISGYIYDVAVNASIKKKRERIDAISREICSQTVTIQQAIQDTTLQETDITTLNQLYEQAIDLQTLKLPHLCDGDDRHWATRADRISEIAKAAGSGLCTAGAVLFFIGLTGLTPPAFISAAMVIGVAVLTIGIVFLCSYRSNLRKRGAMRRMLYEKQRELHDKAKEYEKNQRAGWMRQIQQKTEADNPALSTSALIPIKATFHPAKSPSCWSTLCAFFKDPMSTISPVAHIDTSSLFSP